MSNTNPHKGHRARLKKEFRENGLDHFADHKILELLLFYAIPRADTNEIAHELLDRFGSISGVLDSPIHLLQEAKGLGEESATFLRFVSDLIRVYMDDHTKTDGLIVTTAEAKRYMQHKFVGITLERVLIACLAPNGKIISSGVLMEGSPESVSIRPVDIVRAALRADAVKIILAHNHPHGFANPSNVDVYTTQIIHKELVKVEVELFDHIIVSPQGAFSMREAKMLTL